jgi:hypothetical protein
VALGVKKKTTNIPMWGDTGRHPITISMVKLLIDFHNRLAVLNDDIKVVDGNCEQL